MNNYQKELNLNNIFERFGTEDLSFIFNFLLRNKKLISISSLLFFITSLLISFNIKKVWQGEFEIVIDSEKNPLTSLNPLVTSVIPGVTETNKLITEVGILESPFVLLPVFNYVKDFNKETKSNLGTLPFSGWKKNYLDIKLKKKTSILSINYKDKNKDLILPVLQKISDAYQKYSGSNRTRGIELTKNFFDDQINFYKKKSSDSLKNVQEFADAQDLILINNRDISIKESDEKINSNSPNSINFTNLNLEIIRANTANEIRKIDEQILKIKELANDLEQLQYVGSTIPGLVSSGLPKSLEDIETELSYARTKFSENDKTIITLKNERELLRKVLIERAIGYLKAEKLELESLKESVSRPKGVFLKYKELLREAERDEKTLIQLENDLRLLKLTEAKIEDPWKLITNPTIRKNPVHPNKKNIALISLVAGFFAGFLISIYREIKNDLIYEDKSIENILHSKIIDVYNLKNNKFFFNNKEIFVNEIFKNILNLKIFISEDIDPKNYKLFIENILEINDKSLFSVSLSNFSNEDNIILLLPSKMKLTYQKLNTLNKRLSYLNLDLFGIIILDES